MKRTNDKYIFEVSWLNSFRYIFWVWIVLLIFNFIFDFVTISNFDLNEAINRFFVIELFIIVLVFFPVFVYLLRKLNCVEIDNSHIKGASNSIKHCFKRISLPLNGIRIEKEHFLMIKVSNPQCPGSNIFIPKFIDNLGELRELLSGETQVIQE